MNAVKGLQDSSAAERHSLLEKVPREQLSEELRQELDFALAWLSPRVSWSEKFKFVAAGPEAARRWSRVSEWDPSSPTLKLRDLCVGNFKIVPFTAVLAAWGVLQGPDMDFDVASEFLHPVAKVPRLCGQVSDAF